jgi:hypothetical protein
VVGKSSLLAAPDFVHENLLARTIGSNKPIKKRKI